MKSYISLHTKDGASYLIDSKEIITPERLAKEEFVTLKFAFDSTRLTFRSSEISGWTLSTPNFRKAHREYCESLDSEAEVKEW